MSAEGERQPFNDKGKGCCVMSDRFHKDKALFPIGIVMKLTDLTARQIRYYEQHGLVKPARTSGNQRLFSLHDIERLLEIKDLIQKGVNIAGIKQLLQPLETSLDDEVRKNDTKRLAQHPAIARSTTRDLSDSEVHQFLKRELLESRERPGKVSLIQGELSRFFK